MEEPRICIIGAGGLSTRRIYPNIGAAGGHLVGVCDLDADKAQRNARLFGGKPYADAEQMLDELKPDGVMVCVGPGAHGELARKVLLLGYPVYTEKPPALTAADALEVARTSARTNLLCTTAFKKRYNNAYTRAGQFIESVSPGELMSVAVTYASGQYTNADKASSFLLDFAIHCIDLIGFLAGEAVLVMAMTQDHHAYAVSIQFASGAVGTLSLCDGRSFSVPTEQVEITLGGGNFMTITNSSSWRIMRDGKCSEWREPPTFTSAGDSGRETGHLAEIEDFFAALAEKRSTRSNIYESYKSMVLYEAIDASARSGKVVDVVYQPQP